jgi:hypothetical protein
MLLARPRLGLTPRLGLARRLGLASAVGLGLAWPQVVLLAPLCLQGLVTRRAFTKSSQR